MYTLMYIYIYTYIYIYVYPYQGICLRSLLATFSTVITYSTFSMGWLRLVASIILQVSFAKEPYKRDYILQKRPII